MMRKGIEFFNINQFKAFLLRIDNECKGNYKGLTRTYCLPLFHKTTDFVAFEIEQNDTETYSLLLSELTTAEKNRIVILDENYIL